MNSFNTVKIMADSGLVEVRIPKALLVLTKDEFTRALKRGKYIRRTRATETRERKELERSREGGGYDSGN